MGADQALASADRAGVAVSRETADRLALYVALLRRWNPVKNLVSPHTLGEVWERHVTDSLQLVRIAPEARVWVDMGSGGGLPALVVAAVLAGKPGVEVHCIESKLGKAAFLQEAARQMRVPVTVWARRIEDVVGHDLVSADVVTARALAPMKDLLRLANPLLKTGALGIFPKGQDVASELTEAAIYWKFDHRSVPSVTDPRGRIIVVQGVERRTI
ncbi:MAG: 16S rRNA (guanine527-N7)-methyltransferase [Xanthobacteraceae bacterium]|nr:MAG: 16S rRNA (guanine527-N7)-methyltransferase [Xanthobacteraceae bacterium]